MYQANWVCGFFWGMAKLVSQKTDDVKKKILQMIFQKNLS